MFLNVAVESFSAEKENYEIHAGQDLEIPTVNGKLIQEIAREKERELKKQNVRRRWWSFWKKNSNWIF